MDCPPILFLIFNRPDVTARVFQRIREARPSALYIAADGPREQRSGELDVCLATRRVVEEAVDWPCELHKRYLDTNAGCRVAVSSAISWFFENEESGIVLEDDCLPTPTFFPFCSILLEKYRLDQRVMQVCGTNVGNYLEGDSSYFYSRLSPIWGWASWRRAWQLYDLNMATWKHCVESDALSDACWTRAERAWRKSLFERVASNRLDTWDYQWSYAKLMHSGLGIIPRANLVSNIGYGSEATHTIAYDRTRAELPVASMKFPLVSPAFVVPSRQFDAPYIRGAARLHRLTESSAWKLASPFTARLTHFLRRFNCTSSPVLNGDSLRNGGD